MEREIRLAKIKKQLLSQRSATIRKAQQHLGEISFQDSPACYLCPLDVYKRQVFEPVQSDEQIVPIIESLECDIKRIFQVNIPNCGQLVEGFPEDVVVECEGVVSGAGINGVHMGRLPDRVMAKAMYPRFAQCELLCQAAKGDIEALRCSLLMNHQAKSLAQVDALIDRWLKDPRNLYAGVFA